MASLCLAGFYKLVDRVHVDDEGRRTRHALLIVHDADGGETIAASILRADVVVHLAKHRRFFDLALEAHGLDVVHVGDGEIAAQAVDADTAQWIADTLCGRTWLALSDEERAEAERRWRGLGA